LRNLPGVELLEGYIGYDMIPKVPKKSNNQNKVKDKTEKE
jgi:hypothetical protein